MGWPIGILIDGANTVQAAIDDSMWIHNTIVSGWTATTAMDTVSSNGLSFDMSTWFTNNAGRTYATNTEVMLSDPFNLDNPNFLPMLGSPALTGYDTPPNDGFFDPSGTFVGAFGSTDWTENWTDFTPGDYVLSVEETELDGIPASFELAQNYPNPFNPSTKIRYSLTNASNVKLTVFNVLGQEVAILVDGLRQAGTYEVNFEATNLPAGIYLYTLKAGSFEVTKKMALLK